MKSDKQIPENVMNEFLTFLTKANTRTTRKYLIDADTGNRVLVQEIEVTQQNDLKATLALYERIYPQYFDPLTRERLLKIKQENDSSNGDNIGDKIRDAFRVVE